MAIQEHKAILALGAASVFILGVVVGGLATRLFFFPASPPAEIPVPLLLEETHRLLDKGQLAEAEKGYQSVLSREPGNPEAITHIGNIAFQRGDVERALVYYDEALRRDPAYAHALWDKGIALRTKGDYAGAIAAWEAFARLFPADSKDVVQVKKWIAEAQEKVGSKKAGSGEPEKMIRELSKISKQKTSKEKGDR